jgi:hypothetical protein
MLLTYAHSIDKIDVEGTVCVEVSFAWSLSEAQIAGALRIERVPLVQQAAGVC